MYQHNFNGRYQQTEVLDFMQYRFYFDKIFILL